MSAPDDSAVAPDAVSPEARRAARLAAVQALYQRDMNEISARAVIAEFAAHRFTGDADQALFEQLVKGVDEQGEEIDRRISGALVEGWSLVRLETVLRAIFRAGVCELLLRWDVPPRVTISEYVEISHGFFAGREPAMVNGVLDRLAREIRPEEFSGAKSPD
jgi:N utilization substance protein B